MRTTLDLDDLLLAEARHRATERGISLSALVEEGLTLALARGRSSAKPYRMDWKTHAGRLLPGIDLSDRSSIDRWRGY